MRSKNFDDIVMQQIRFSGRAFGPGPRTNGLCAHIQKELDEIHDAPDDPLEWIDVVILGTDGAWRCFKAQFPWMDDSVIATHVAEALQYKINQNANRTWPDWREKSLYEAIEHVRKGEADA